MLRPIIKPPLPRGVPWAPSRLKSSFTRSISDKEIRRRWHEAPEPKIDNADLTRQQMQRLVLQRKLRRKREETAAILRERSLLSQVQYKRYEDQKVDAHWRNAVLQGELEYQKTLLADDGVPASELQKYALDAGGRLIYNDQPVPDLSLPPPEPPQGWWASLTADEKQRLGIVVFGVSLFGAATLGWFLLGGESEDSVELEKAASGGFAKATVAAIRDQGSTRFLDVKLNPGHPFLDAEPLQGMALMEPYMSIQRAYTPLDLAIDPANHMVSFMIRLYPDGDLSRYVRSLAVGDSVRLRGPLQTYPLWAFQTGELPQVPAGEQSQTPDKPKQLTPVSFVVAGTGVTPAIQYARYLLAHSDDAPTDTPLVNIVYASRSDSDILLKKELDALQAASNGRIRIHYFVRNASLLRTLADRVVSLFGVEPNVHHAAIDAAALRKLSLPKSRVVVSGSERFVTDLAGPRGKPLGGVLAQLGYANDRVVRL